MRGVSRMIVSCYALVVFLLSVALLLQHSESSSFISVNNSTKQFIDSTGRTRIFHGVNAVYKIPPWHPELTTWNTDTSLTETDVQYLQEWGFTAIRLGVMWPGVSVSANQYNQTYLEVMANLVNELGAGGIYTIVDCHQDLFSRFFCGEGAPDWAVPTERLTLEFPLPIGKPSSIEYDPITGYPNLTTCLEREFSTYYFSAAVGEAFQCLYDNKHHLQDHLISFWKEVATTFKDNEYVLGYELINEPWAGNIYHHPKALLDPGYADRTFLMPMYQNITNAIRSIDDEHIIFFESAVSDIYPCGFEGGPGGPTYDDRQAYSYHVYCAPTNDNGDPTKPRLCNLTDEYMFDIKQMDRKRMGVAGFMTEFGALEGTPDGVEAINYLLAKADDNLQSWTYWEYKFYNDLTTVSSSGSESFWVNGTLDYPKVKALSRTYAQIIAGNPISQTFDPETGSYSLTYETTEGLQSDITQIYFNSEYYYASGMNVSLSAGLSIVSQSQTILLVSNGNADGQVTISITSLA